MFNLLLCLMVLGDEVDAIITRAVEEPDGGSCTEDYHQAVAATDLVLVLGEHIIVLSESYSIEQAYRLVGMAPVPTRHFYARSLAREMGYLEVAAGN